MPLLWLLLPKEQQRLSAAHLGPSRSDNALLFKAGEHAHSTSPQHMWASTSAHSFTVSLFLKAEFPSVPLPPGRRPEEWSSLQIHTQMLLREIGPLVKLLLKWWKQKQAKLSVCDAGKRNTLMAIFLLHWSLQQDFLFCRCFFFKVHEIAKITLRLTNMSLLGWSCLIYTACSYLL